MHMIDTDNANAMSQIGVPWKVSNDTDDSAGADDAADAEAADTEAVDADDDFAIKGSDPPARF